MASLLWITEFQTVSAVKNATIMVQPTLGGEVIDYAGGSTAQASNFVGPFALIYSDTNCWYEFLASGDATAGMTFLPANLERVVEVRPRGLIAAGCKLTVVAA